MGIEKIWLEVYGEPINIFGYPESFIYDQENKTLSVDFPYLFESEEVFNVEALYCIALGLNYAIKKDFVISQVLRATLSQKPSHISNYVKKKSALVNDQDNRAWSIDSSGKFDQGLSIVSKITGKNQIVIDYDQQEIVDFSSDLKGKTIKLRSKVCYSQWVEELPDHTPLSAIIHVIKSCEENRIIESYQGIVSLTDRSRILDPIQTLRFKNVELTRTIAI